jgi:membrane associated rhomboid family serine protease
MIPLNDSEPNRYIRLPVMTLTIITINCIVMLIVFSSSPSVEALLPTMRKYGAIPTVILARQGGASLTSITHLFLHGGLWHLFGNMLGLWVYGRRVEDMCGPVRFLLFYLTCGVFANIISTMAQAQSDIPTIGASGALFGVMGAYLILFPKGRIRTLVVLGVIPIFPRIRASWLILFFLLLELPPAFNILFRQADYQIGHWAHLGGFIASLSIMFFIRPEAFQRYRNDLPL